VSYHSEPAPDPIRRATIATEPTQEWLITNGLGGYASGTVLGIPTRRYHGLLIAALPNPAGRVMMLSSLPCQLRMKDGTRVDVGWGPPNHSANKRLDLVEFTLELGLPVWRYQGHGITLEKRIVLSYQTNTTMVMYRLVEGGPVRLELRPALQFRGHDDPVSTAVPEAYPLHAYGSRIEIVAPNNVPSLRLHLAGGRTSFVVEPLIVPDLAYSTEASRGYESRGQLFSPGRFRADLEVNGQVALIASTEGWDTIMAVSVDGTVARQADRPLVH